MKPFFVDAYYSSFTEVTVRIKQRPGAVGYG